MPIPIIFALLVAAQTGSSSNEEEPPEGDSPAPTQPAKRGDKKNDKKKVTDDPSANQPRKTSAVIPAEKESPSEPATEAPEPGPAERADVSPRADDFFQFSDFVDSSLTFIFSNKNLFAGPGERLSPTSGFRIGVDPDFRLFHENINTRFTGYETFSRLVLYKKLPGFFPLWETEAALAALLLADTDTGKFTFFDSGTYLRVIRKLSDGPEAKTGSIDLTAWPVSADRFRLGYTYIISWGGTAIFPGKLQSSSITEGAVPGFRLRWRAPEGSSYAYVGGKSALLLSRAPGAMSGEQVPNYALLVGGGSTIAEGFSIEANGGVFQKGTQVRPGLEGKHINAYGASARVTLFDNISNREINDYRLYRNDPSDPVDYLIYKEYRPGSGYNIALEGNFLLQNLEDPERFGSEKLIYAPSGGLVAQAKLEELYLTLYGFFQSADFILFNVPGFVPFQAIPAGSKTRPELFGAIQGEYVLDEGRFRPSLSAGIKVPATYKGQVLAAEGISPDVAKPGEVRTQVILNETTRIVLPADSSAVPIFGSVLKLPYAISRGMVASFEGRFEIDNNQPRLANDLVTGQSVPFFDKPYRVSLAVLLQSRW
jgi:hypothetical protein